MQFFVETLKVNPLLVYGTDELKGQLNERKIKFIDVD